MGNIGPFLGKNGEHRTLFKQKGNIGPGEHRDDPAIKLVSIVSLLMIAQQRSFNFSSFERHFGVSPLRDTKLMEQLDNFAQYLLNKPPF